MLLGAVERRGQAWRVTTAISVTVLIQTLYLAAFNAAGNSNWGLVFMYLFVFVPLGAGFFLLSRYGEEFRLKYILGMKAART